MTALEVCLVLIGITAIVVRYFISEKVSYEKLEEAARNLVLSEESKEKLINQTKETVKNILEDMTEDIAGKAERELEKLSNEKIMSVHDYSNTILEEINKNHNEVMFLYSMLDDKDKEIKNTVHKVQDTIKSIRRMEEELEEQEAVAEPEGIVPEIQPEEISMLLDTEEKDDLKNNNDIILQLHKEGKSNLEIARALGLGLGEVKLVLDLFQGVMP